MRDFFLQNSTNKNLLLTILRKQFTSVVLLLQNQHVLCHSTELGQPAIVEHGPWPPRPFRGSKCTWIRADIRCGKWSATPPTEPTMFLSEYHLTIVGNSSILYTKLVVYNSLTRYSRGTIRHLSFKDDWHPTYVIKLCKR